MNTPYYYSECVKVVGPLMEQGRDMLKRAAIYVSESTTHFIVWVKENTPQAVEWVRPGPLVHTTVTQFNAPCPAHPPLSSISVPRCTPRPQTACLRRWHTWGSCSSSSIRTTLSRHWCTYLICCRMGGSTYRTPASQYFRASACFCFFVVFFLTLAGQATLTTGCLVFRFCLFSRQSLCCLFFFDKVSNYSCSKLQLIGSKTLICIYSHIEI